MEMMFPNKGFCVNIPLIGYQRAWDIQKRIVSAKTDGYFRDTILILEHPPVITVGRSGNLKNLRVKKEELKKKGIDLYHVERGGDITYHGPGQIVGYPVVYFERYGYRHRRYIYELEEVIIRVLDDLGIRCRRHPELRGVWVGDQKIASVGVAVKGHVAFHGFALNVDPNFEHFAMINPCGSSPDKMTSVGFIAGEEINSIAVRKGIVEHFKEVFKLDLEEISLERLEFMVKNVDRSQIDV